MNSTFLTYPFSSKFHLSMWLLLGLLVQVPEDFAACLKIWETTNTLTNYLSSLAIAVAFHAFWSDLLAVMNSPLEEAVRVIKVVLQWGEIQWWLLQQAVPKPCLLSAWAGGPAGRENQLLRGLIRSRLTKANIFPGSKINTNKQTKTTHTHTKTKPTPATPPKYICKWNSVCNRGLIKCYFGSIKTFHCYESKALWPKFSLWKLCRCVSVWK